MTVAGIPVGDILPVLGNIPQVAAADILADSLADTNINTFTADVLDN